MATIEEQEPPTAEERYWLKKIKYSMCTTPKESLERLRTQAKTENPTRAPIGQAGVDARDYGARATATTPTPEWVAEVKGSEGSFEVSVCYGKPSLSWGFYGPAKIKLEMGTLAEDAERAKHIAAALNAAGYTPFGHTPWPRR